MPATTDEQSTEPTHRAHAVAANNAAWSLLERDALSAEEAEDLLRCAFASAYHWARADGRGPENDARAEYLIAKAYVKVGNPDEALRHAHRCHELTASAGLVDFDLAYAHEALARAHALAGNAAASLAAWRAAKSVPISDPDDRAIVEADFADAPD